MTNNEALERLKEHRILFEGDFGWDTTTLEALDVAIRILSADDKPVVRGEWVCDEQNIKGDVWNRWSCSECGAIYSRGWAWESEGRMPRANFCPNCGADMRKLSERMSNDEI